MGQSLSCLKKAFYRCLNRQQNQKESVKELQLSLIKLEDNHQENQLQLEIDEEEAKERRVEDAKKASFHLAEYKQYCAKTPLFEVENIEDYNRFCFEGLAFFDEMMSQNENLELLLNENEMQIWFTSYHDAEKCVVSVYRFQFTLNNADIESFHRFLSNPEVQKELDKSVDTFELVSGDEFLGLWYLRYKQILFMDPRETVYVKKGIRTNCELIEFSKSVEVKNFKPKKESQKQPMRALLHYGGCRATQIEERKLLVNFYTETNIRIKLNASITKKLGANEIRKRLQNMRNYFA